MRLGHVVTLMCLLSALKSWIYRSAVQRHLGDIRAEIEANVSNAVPAIARDVTQCQSVNLGLPDRPVKLFVRPPQICPVVNQSIVNFEHHLQTMKGTAGVQNAFFHPSIFWIFTLRRYIFCFQVIVTKNVLIWCLCVDSPKTLKSFFC